MFAYNPTVNDESGAILASGKIGAAQANSQMMQGLGEDIGGALKSIGGTIGSVYEQNAMGDSAYEALGAIGEMYPGMKNTFTALGKMDKRTRRLASLSILGNLGAVSQLGIAGQNAGVREKAMDVQMAMPGARAAATNAATVQQRGAMMPGARFQRNPTTGP